MSSPRIPLRRRILSRAVVPALFAIVLCVSAPARADLREPINTAMVPADQLPANLHQVGVDQKLGSLLPRELEFRDELGRTVRLGQLLDSKPVVLTLAYFKCPGLCTLVLSGVVDAMRRITPQLGRDYHALTVSISPGEGPRLALAKKRTTLTRYARAAFGDDDPGWRFLTGDEPAIRKLAQAVGFRYQLDPASGEYSHASVAMILTPDGRMSQYLFGIRFDPPDLERAIERASSSGIGTPLGELLLYCFHYDASTGRWSPRIMNLLRVLAALTALGLACGLALTLRKERLA